MLAVLLCLLMMTAGAVPPLPAEFYGKVTVDGTPASIGTALIAKEKLLFPLPENMVGPASLMINSLLLQPKMM
jgi:hypothetical protein